MAWLANKIDDEILAKPLILYAWAKKLMPTDNHAEIVVGYYSDLEGNAQCLKLYKRQGVVKKMPFTFMKEGCHPLCWTLEKFPSKHWNLYFPEGNIAVIPFKDVSACIEKQCTFILEKTSANARNPLCIFKASQDEGQPPVRFAICPEQSQDCSSHSPLVGRFPLGSHPQASMTSHDDAMNLIFKYLSRNLSGDWIAVGRYLGLTNAEVDYIRAENASSTVEAIYQMLHMWMRQEGPNATNQNLIDALLKAGRVDLAEYMRNHKKVQVTPYEWFLHTLSAHLTATVPENLCNHFNITMEEKSSIISSRNPGLSFLIALDKMGVIKFSDVAALRKPLTEFKLVQAAAKVEEYDMQTKESGEHFPMMRKLDLEGKRKLFIQCLKQKIKSWYETMTPVPWKKSCKWKAADLFVGSGLILTNSIKSKVDPSDIDSTCKLQYDDVWTHKSLELESRLILEGEPGSGKTMLASQLAYDWSQSKFPNVELLVFLPLKFVGEMTLAEAVKEFYIPDHIPLTEKDLDEILEKGNLETCIILDGLEEYNPKVTEEEGKHDVHKVMSKNKYPTCKVIITARSDYAKDLPACKMLKVGRFSKTERNTYIEKVFPDDEEKQKQIQRVINESPFLLDMCRVPLLFVLVLHNFESIDKYKDEKLEKVTPFMMSIDDTLCEHIGGIEEFGNSRNAKNRSALEELAFAGLCRGFQNLSWQRDDVEEIIDNVNEWIDAGIFIIEDDISVKVKGKTKPEDTRVPSTSKAFPEAGLQEEGEGTSQDQSSVESDSTEGGMTQNVNGLTSKHVPSGLKFLHKLFQEWFAAKHLSSKIWSSKKESFSDVLNSIDPIDLHYILRFTCYLCPPSCHLILSHLMKKYHESTERQKEAIMDCICLCFAEYNETKGHDIEVIVKDVCKETIIIQSQDSRLLRCSKTEVLKFASQCQIPIMNLELRDVVTAVQGKILILEQYGSVEVVDSLQYINVSRWDNTFCEKESSNIVDLIASSHSVKHAVLEFPFPPPKVDDMVLLKVSSKNMKIEWKVGQMVFTLNHQSGGWEMFFNGHGRSNRDMSLLDPYPESTESEKEKQPRTNSLLATSTDSFQLSVHQRTKKQKGIDSTTQAAAPEKKTKVQEVNVGTTFCAVAPSQSSECQNSLETKTTITKTGGVLEIPNTGVVLNVPPKALPEDMEQCEMHLRIIPSGLLKEKVTSFSSNSSAVVELLPDSLSLQRPVRLSLPHCLVFEGTGDRKARIFISHHRKGRTPQWEEQNHLSYHLEDTACIVYLHTFCWVKISINDEIVKAKKLVLYAAARNLRPLDKMAEIYVGYYLDLPDEKKIIQDTQDLVIAHRKIFYFMKSGYPLQVSLDNIFPSGWQYGSKRPRLQEITYRQIKSCTSYSIIYTLKRKSSTAGNPLGVFSVSQENGQISVKLAIHLKAVDTDPSQLTVMEPSKMCSLVERYEAPMKAVSKTITNTGGSLQIPDSDVILEIPQNALPADMDSCLMWIRITESRIVEDQVKSLCSNASTAVELFPSNLRLRRSAKLILPHCLQFKKGKTSCARIYTNNESGSQSPWREKPNMSYELTDSACIVHLKKFCCIKYAIDEKRVIAKRIRVYTAVKKMKESDELAEVEVGFYSDMPGGQELLRLNPDLVIDSQRTLHFMEEQNFSLELSLDSILPDEQWTCCIPKEKPQEIPFRVIASSMEHSHLYILQKAYDEPGSVTCRFKAMQKEGLMPVDLSLRLPTSFGFNQSISQKTSEGKTAQQQKKLELDSNNLTLMFLSKNLEKEWEAVCGRLKVTTSQIFRAKADSPNNVQRAIFQSLLTWRKNMASAATFGILADALRLEGRGDLAEDVLKYADLFSEGDLLYFKTADVQK